MKHLWERLKSDLLPRIGHFLGGLLLLLFGLAVIALNVLDTLGVMNHHPEILRLQWWLIALVLIVVGIVLLCRYIRRRRERRKAGEVVRQRKENPPPN